MNELIKAEKKHHVNNLTAMLKLSLQRNLL